MVEETLALPGCEVLQQLFRKLPVTASPAPWPFQPSVGLDNELTEGIFVKQGYDQFSFPFILDKRSKALKGKIFVL